ncbi:MAG TPA: LLM class flavin-dependent oxidoreductase [Xanthobacteraceae bacterium]|nr:LLM class flavin-dependent oxidoreductase [Xanthobacteraceae bacterium]
MPEKREIRLNAFVMNTVGHQSPGLWAHPRDRSDRYVDLEHWKDLARLLERGRFDGVFFADVLGVYDVYGGTVEAALRHAVQVPVNDPMLLVPAMADVTEHLGFGITGTLSYEPPYPFARRFSTLDHLTKGRVGWNIVTGYLDSAAKAMGLSGQYPHARRYDVAEEYMQVVYKLWEGSWEGDAASHDRVRRIYADPKKVHRVRHQGEFYSLDAIHVCEPSPQRTPVLYQAGASGRGREFAAAHAECVFINGPSTKVVAPYVADIRGRALTFGRAAEDIKIFTLATVITGRDEAEARAKYEDYRRFIDVEASLTLFSGWTGVDFSRYRLDEPLRAVTTDAMRSALSSFTSEDPDRIWTVREIAQHVGIGGRGPVMIGSPAQVADALEHWVDTTGIDGFNLAYAVMPETFEDFVNFVVPELQRRGRFKREYRTGTLRQKLTGAANPYLPATHPGAKFRV